MATSSTTKHAKAKKLDVSIVEYIPEREGYRCGYCGSSDGNFSNGMWAHCLGTDDYQGMIDRGWRRSGKYCYKPDMRRMCCPCYTIRCSALDYLPSRSQKRVALRLIRYLATGEKPKRAASAPDPHMQGPEEPRAPGTVVATSQEVVATAEHEALAEPRTTERLPCAEDPARSGAHAARTTEEMNVAEGTTPPDPEKARGHQMKAKHLRRKRCVEKALGQAKLRGVSVKEILDEKKSRRQQKNARKTVEELVALPGGKPAHTLELRLVRSHPESPEFVASYPQSLRCYQKYQMAIHKDDLSKVTERQHRNFLVDSPLLPSEMATGAAAEEFPGYGSFHQQYWLDGRLIAVGVLDILPACVSSVYLYYDPDYAFLSLGTYSALQEIALARRLHALKEDIRYYYMGFYIHSCQKMRYKGRYAPSYLACPEVYSWEPISKCTIKLDASKYARLCEDNDAVDPEGTIDVNSLLVLFRKTVMDHKTYLEEKKSKASRSKAARSLQSSTVSEEVLEYARLVGNTLCQSLVLYRSS